MCFAETTGDKMTCWILTEHPAPSTPTDPLLEPQLLEANIVVHQEEDNGSGETPADDPDIDEAVSVGNEMENELEIKDSLDPSDLTEVYDRFEVKDSEDSYSFVKIINHCWRITFSDAILEFTR